MTTPVPPQDPGQEWVLATAADTRAFGRLLGEQLRAGDLVLLSGDLGAGKTTLTQGLAQGLGVRGPITSPTFVIAREHHSLGSGPSLVHVDAYRLGGRAELDDLDLDTAVEEAVTVVEWGAGLIEQLTTDRLEVTLQRPDVEDTLADPEEEPRRVQVRGVGARWSGMPIAAAGERHDAEPGHLE